MPKAFVAEDGTILKACPQCIKDELAIFPEMNLQEAEQKVTRPADEYFCRSKRTADGYQSWCKTHINEKNKERKKRNAGEEADRRARALENAQRSQAELQKEAEERRAAFLARQDAAIGDDLD